MKRILMYRVGLAIALLCCGASTVANATEARETPLVQAVKRGRSSVANIHTEKTVNDRDTVFGSARGRKVNGMGTGIVIDERGYLATNYHVIADVDSIRVTFEDGSTYDGEVISFDREHDLAMVRVANQKPLNVMPLGTSSDLMLGETVIAVGNAFGYEHTITSGIISALSRDVEVNDEQSYQNLIQTDASINPGNSGGPLLNLDGEVVGINVAIRAGAQRIGFAIPIDDAREIIANLISIEQLDRHYHGVVARSFKDGAERRLIVETVRDGSPAAEAGIKPGDVIVSIGDTPIVDRVDLERAFLEQPQGQPLDVVVKRSKERAELSLALVDLGNRSPVVATTPMVARANNDEESMTDQVWGKLGMKLAPLPTNQRYLVGPRYRGGMQIIDVRGGSPAAASGIQSGDILVGLHQWETISEDNIRWILNQSAATPVSPMKFFILRGRETRYGHLKIADGVALRQK